MLWLAESYRVTSSDSRAAGQDISTLEERLAEEAKQLREAAELRALQKARKNETDAHINERLSLRIPFRYQVLRGRLGSHTGELRC